MATIRLGFMKYFQIAKCFRDENIRLDRRPEFTQLYIELSLVNEEYIFNFIEGLLKNVFLKTIGVDLKTNKIILFKVCK